MSGIGYSLVGTELPWDC